MDMKITMTCAVQGNMCHFFLPYTPEGESYRWDVAICPAGAALDVSRADKLASKSGSLGFLRRLLAIQERCLPLGAWPWTQTAAGLQRVWKQPQSQPCVGSVRGLAMVMLR